MCYFAKIMQMRFRSFGSWSHQTSKWGKKIDLSDLAKIISETADLLGVFTHNTNGIVNGEWTVFIQRFSSLNDHSKGFTLRVTFIHSHHTLRRSLILHYSINGTESSATGLNLGFCCAVHWHFIVRTAKGGDRTGLSIRGWRALPPEPYHRCDPIQYLYVVFLIKCSPRVELWLLCLPDVHHLTWIWWQFNMHPLLLHIKITMPVFE